MRISSVLSTPRKKCNHVFHRLLYCQLTTRISFKTEGSENFFAVSSSFNDILKEKLRQKIWIIEFIFTNIAFLFVSFIIMRCYSILFKKSRFLTRVKSVYKSRDNDKKMRDFPLIQRNGVKIARGKSDTLSTSSPVGAGKGKRCELRTCSSKLRRDSCQKDIRVHH